jgi:hypothetical protein
MLGTYIHTNCSADTSAGLFLPKGLFEARSERASP